MSISFAAHGSRICAIDVPKARYPVDPKQSQKIIKLVQDALQCLAVLDLRHPSDHAQTRRIFLKCAPKMTTRTTYVVDSTTSAKKHTTAKDALMRRWPFLRLPLPSFYRRIRDNKFVGTKLLHQGRCSGPTLNT